jgi:hypothetical protein
MLTCAPLPSVSSGTSVLLCFGRNSCHFLLFFALPFLTFGISSLRQILGGLVFFCFFLSSLDSSVPARQGRLHVFVDLTNVQSFTPYRNGGARPGFVVICLLIIAHFFNTHT